MFETKPNEEVIDVIRKSFYKVFPKLLKSFSLILPAVFALLYVDIPIVTLISLFWLIIVLAYILNLWLVWYYDVYILTSDRIIEIRHKSLFIKEVVEIPLGKIQDVSFSIDGFGSAVFGYGTVKIISDLHDDIDLESVKNPEDTRRLILEVREGKK